MKKKLKLLISSALITLKFAPYQAILGMDGGPDEPYINRLIINDNFEEAQNHGISIIARQGDMYEKPGSFHVEDNPKLDKHLFDEADKKNDLATVAHVAANGSSAEEGTRDFQSPSKAIFISPDKKYHDDYFSKLPGEIIPLILTCLDYSDLLVTGNVSIMCKKIVTKEWEKRYPALQMEEKKYKKLLDLIPLMGFTSLNVRERGIVGHDASVLCYFRGLTSLNVSQYLGKHISCLTALTDLTKLNISRNKLGEWPGGELSFKGVLNPGSRNDHVSRRYYSILPKLTCLTSLDLSDNGLEGQHVSSLACLTGLTDLFLNENNMHEHTDWLTSLTGLTNLGLGSSNLYNHDLKALSSSTGLTSLNLSSNNLNNLRCLAPLTKLTKLNVAFNQKLNGRVSCMTGLTSLDLSYNGLNRSNGDILKELFALTLLTELNVSGNDLSQHADYLTALTKLIPSLKILRNPQSDKNK